MKGLVQRGPDQVVHAGINNNKLLAAAFFKEQHPGQKNG